MKNNRKSIILPMLLQFLSGVFAGGVVAFLIIYNAITEARYPLLLGLAVGFLLQIILHELGHLIFGLISGYSFTSFRIFGIAFVKSEGRLAVKRYKLAGTLGQCLMAPTLKNDGKIPTLLYNMGGVMLDSLTMLLSVALALLFNDNTAVFSSAMIMTALCFISVVSNGVPMRSSLACNDGYNAITASRSYGASLAFANQLRVNARSYAGERLRDMPSELFEYSEAELSNPQVAALANMRVGRLIDLGEYDGAYKLGVSLLNNGADLFPIYRGLLSLDMAYLSAILFHDASVAESYVSEDEKRLIKALSNIPSVHRTRYALALVAGDTNAAERALSDFNKAIKKHPSSAESESDRELVALAKELLCAVSPA